MKLFREFLYFLKKPELGDPVSLSFFQSLMIVLRSIPIYFLFIFICSIIFIPLSFFNLIPEFPHRNRSDIIDLVILAPILEELLFRLPLRNFFKNIFLSISLLFYALTKSVLGIYIVIPSSILILILPYIPGLFIQIETIVNKNARKFFPAIFYIISLIFGFLHITNFDHLTKTQYFISPAIVFYQILLGFYLGFLRVRFKWGIIYSIVTHAVFNSFPVLIKMIF